MHSSSKSEFTNQMGHRLIWLVLFLTIPVGSAKAQWHRLLDEPGFIRAIDFIPFEGSTNIGFVLFGDRIYRSSDSGWAWSLATVNASDDSYRFESGDLAFRNGGEGWISAWPRGMEIWDEGGLFKTTDAGRTWNIFPSNAHDANGLRYVQSKDWLLTSGAGYDGWCYRISHDSIEQHRMVRQNQWNGFAFNSEDSGILSSQHVHQSNGFHEWPFTTDAGVTWGRLSIDSPTTQPLAIKNSQTYFALTSHGSVLRTDDFWKTWRILHTFPFSKYVRRGTYNRQTSSGCIRGDMKNLVVQTAEGGYCSTDEGETWKYLCGPIAEVVTWRRFYAKDNVILMAGYSEKTGKSVLYRLNLDSLDITTDISCRFPNDQKTETLDASSREVRVVCRIIDRTPDSVRVRIRYDADAFRYSRAEVPNGWTVHESLEPEAVNVAVVKGPIALATDSTFTLVFSTILSKDRAELIVEAQKVFSFEFDAECVASRPQQQDTLTVLFQDCESDLLLKSMNGEKALEIKSITPNPTQDKVTIEWEARVAGVLKLEVYSVVGVLVHEEVVALASAGKPITLDTRSWPSGAYSIVLRSGDEEARGTVIKN